MKVNPQHPLYLKDSLNPAVLDLMEEQSTHRHPQHANVDFSIFADCWDRKSLGQKILGHSVLSVPTHITPCAQFEIKWSENALGNSLPPALHGKLMEFTAGQA